MGSELHGLAVLDGFKIANNGGVVCKLHSRVLLKSGSAVMDGQYEQKIAYDIATKGCT